MLTGLTILFEILIMIFLRSIGVESRPVALILPMILAVSAVYLFELGRNRRLKPVATPLILGYCMRIFLVIFDIYGRNIYSLPNSGADSERFYLECLAYMEGYSVSGAFPQMTGEIISRIGVSRLYVQFLLMLCSVVALHLLDAMLREINVDTLRRRRVMYIVCLMPNFAILSSIFLRESIVAFFAALSLWAFIKWWVNGRERWFLFAFAAVFFASRFHSGTVAMAIGYIAIRFLYDKRRKVFHTSWKNILPTIVFVTVFVYLYTNHKDVLFGKMANIETIDDIASGHGMGGSTYAAYVGNSSTPLNMLIYTLPRIVFFLFSPFPWHWRGLSDIIAFCFNSVFYLWTVYSAYKYLRSKETGNRSLLIALVLIALVTVFVFAWGTSNTGTAVRHRDKMVILYGVIWALTMQGRKIKWAGKRRRRDGKE